ncbi:dihydrofolate reductase family protein [Ferruginibacter lapsinanis]|uniref:dihydrofolate reductase family protein n=1 Tax=Ferruginibacter lapsinanis TaxID=563172 RepID=UPI001E2B96CF|nr:dihydrofolate reductase family protein [Ferruginibacter lapsinanis]UEG48953.1 dihydrofolate reductase family protein [Ferruginibacter lapsinanis]
MTTNERRLIVFNQITSDGYFVDSTGDMSWAHKHDEEWEEFVAGNATGGALLVFGRITYEMMAGFWSTPFAMEQMPEVAAGMNNLPKLVFSTTLEKATWNNTMLVKAGMADKIREMKKESGRDMVILGSGTIVSQLTDEGLVDEYQLIINPIALGNGRTLFEGIQKPVNFTLTHTRVFKNGNVLLCYVPSK